MRPIFHRLYRRKDGATALEFALVLPVLLWLLFGIIEFSLMMFVSSVIEGATVTIARQSKTGADRSMAANPQDRAAEDMARLREMVLERGRGIIRGDNLDVLPHPNTSPSGTVGQAGEMVIYSVSYEWRIITPFMGMIMGDENGVFNISSITAVVNEPFDGT